MAPHLWGHWPLCLLADSFCWILLSCFSLLLLFLWLQKVEMICCQASSLTGIQMSSLYGERRSRIPRLTRVKGNQALSFCEDARYPPMRLLYAGQKTNEKPTCSDRSYSQPRPRGLFHWRILHTRFVIWMSCVWELNPDPCRGSSV